MNIRYCTICSTSFDLDVEGDEGAIGPVLFAFCSTCKGGVVEYVLDLSLSVIDPVPLRKVGLL